MGKRILRKITGIFSIAMVFVFMSVIRVNAGECASGLVPTGDDSMLMTAAVICAGALAGIIVVLILRRRR